MNSYTDAFMDSRDFARIARSIRFIDSHFMEQPRLADIAADAGLSEFHFNRLFRRWAGLTPKQYLAFVTGSAAQEALASQPSVLEAAFSVGLSGPGRLHDLVVSLAAMTPGEFKSRGRGVLIRHGFSATPFGRALIGETDRGICHLSFTDAAGDPAALLNLEGQWSGARLERDDDHAAEIAARIWSPVGHRTQSSERRGAGSVGVARTSELRVAVAGTNFQLKVWQALIDLGARETTTYSDIAARIGTPSATRAVGNAVGANPVAWLIPCHQVLRKGGALGGYHWGLDRKRAMLAWTGLSNVQPTIRQRAVNRGVRG